MLELARLTSQTIARILELSPRQLAEALTAARAQAHREHQADQQRFRDALNHPTPQ